MDKEVIAVLDVFLKYGTLLITFIVGYWAWYKFNKQREINKELQEQKADLDRGLKQYEQRFSISFEAYKGELQKLAEQQRYMNQRRLTDFNLYTTKKHERSIELHEKLFNARNKVLWRNNPLRQLPTFSDYNREDMIDFLEKYNITKGRKEELLNRWEENQRDVIREIYDLMTSQEELDSNIAISEAVKAHLQADLYLPRDISSEIDQFTTNLNQLAFLCSRETRKTISGEEHQKMYEQRTELAENVEKQFPIIVENMQRMLLNDVVISNYR